MPEPLSSDVGGLRQQLERIARSELFSAKDSLLGLLRFLVEHSISDADGPVRETEIGVRHFGKPHFDPRTDSTVRVQIGRLRDALAHYYSGPGATDPIILELPKGGYRVRFYSRFDPTPENGERSGEHYRSPGFAETATISPSRHSTVFRKPHWIAVGIVVVCLAVAFVIVRSVTARASAIETFWKPFVQHSDDVLVIFSNPRFVGQSITGLKLYDPAQPAPAWINETYSGTGEVFAVHEITRTLTLLHRPITLRRARLLVWEEAKNRDLIFLGSPSQNSPSGELRLRHFAFQNIDGTTGFVNLHPRPGEPKSYVGSGPPYTLDYAVIAQLPGFDPSRRALILAGTTTYGTQAAAEFVCRENSVAELLAKLGLVRGAALPPFEALLQVRIAGGVALESRLLAVRTGK